jgi:uncharacterized protein involved in tolerance to divalent cations
MGQTLVKENLIISFEILKEHKLLKERETFREVLCLLCTPKENFVKMSERLNWLHPYDYCPYLDIQ